MYTRIFFYKFIWIHVLVFNFLRESGVYCVMALEVRKHKHDSRIKARYKYFSENQINLIMLELFFIN